MRKDRRRPGFGHGSVGDRPIETTRRKRSLGWVGRRPPGVPHVVEGRPRRPYGRLGSFLAEGVDDMPRERPSLVQDEEGYEVEAHADAPDTVAVRRKPPGSGLLGALSEGARHLGKAALRPLAGPDADEHERVAVQGDDARPRDATRLPPPGPVPRSPFARAEWLPP